MMGGKNELDALRERASKDRMTVIQEAAGFKEERRIRSLRPHEKFAIDSSGASAFAHPAWPTSRISFGPPGYCYSAPSFQLGVWPARLEWSLATPGGRRLRRNGSRAGQTCPRPGGSLSCCSLLPPFHRSPKSERLRAGLDDMRPVSDAIQQRFAQSRIRKYRRPLGKRKVRRHDQRGPFGAV